MAALTIRERQCLYWAAQGKTSWEMGQILGISERTANFHINNVCEKLEVRTRQAAIMAAFRAGLLNVDSPPGEDIGRCAPTTSQKGRAGGAPARRSPAESAGRRPRRAHSALWRPGQCKESQKSSTGAC